MRMDKKSRVILIVAIAVVGLVAVGGSLIYGFWKADDDANKAMNSMLQFEKQMNKDAIAVEPLVDKLEELRAKEQDASLSAEERAAASAELVGVQNELAETFPDLVDSWTLENNAIMAGTDTIRERLRQMMIYSGD